MLTGQIGYSWNNVLGYVKGGAAVAHDKYEGVVTNTGVAFDRAERTRWGAVVGVGVEYAFAPNWSAGIEYNHMFMGSRDLLFNSTAVQACSPAATPSVRISTRSRPASTTASAARLSPATERQTLIDQGGRPITKAPASAGAFSFGLDPRRVPFPQDQLELLRLSDRPAPNYALKLHDVLRSSYQPKETP